MKTISTVSRFLLKSVVVFGLIAVAGLAGVGIAAFVAFHELGDSRDLSRSAQSTTRAEEVMTPRLISVSRLDRWQGQAIAMNVDASLAANRFVAAGPSDQPQYSYADYQPADSTAPAVSAPHNAARTSVVTTMVPPPLAPASESAEAAPIIDHHVARLTDPGSRFIVDENTGRIVGVDGTAGAMEEARQQQQQQAATAARHGREVRAALPVDADPAAGLPPSKPDLYPAVRRATPVVDPVSDAAPAQPFSAANELADDRPVLRAEAVNITPQSRPQHRLFTLP